MALGQKLTTHLCETDFLMLVERYYLSVQCVKASKNSIRKSIKRVICQSQTLSIEKALKSEFSLC